MAEITAEQAGTAAAYLSDRAGITAAVLAIVCVGLSVYLVWREIQCRKERETSHAAWTETIRQLTEAWGNRVDQMRGDVKEAFQQNAKLADRMVEAMNTVRIEMARMSGGSRRDRE